jgi:hypothetical protein
VRAEVSLSAIVENDYAFSWLTMFSYIVGLVAVLVLLFDPISQLISSPKAVPQIRRIPRPQLNTELLALEDEGNANVTGTACPPDPYSVHIFSREPLVLYIEGFLSAEERAHLLDIRFVFVHLSVALLRLCLRGVCLKTYHILST